jgi:serine phosphatase RsbU (regulator of sigma subunit)
MRPTTKPRASRPAPRISLIEHVQEGIWMVSNAVSANDLSQSLSKALSTLFPKTAILMQRRPAGASEWQILGTGRPDSPPKELPVPSSTTTVATTLDRAGRHLGASHRLAEGAFVGVSLERRSGARFSAADLAAVKTLLHTYAATDKALLARQKEKSLVFSLNHRVLQLNSLIDTGIELAKFDEAVHPEHLALERAASLTNAARGKVTIARADGTRQTIWFPEGASRSAGASRQEHIRSTFTILGHRYTFELFDKESRSGVQPFDETDKLLLDALARQVHASLENRHLHEQALEKQKMERDMAVAASIQKRILPATLPVIAGYDIAGVNIPSKSVGGDYFDCIALPDGRYAFVIADVAGKGVPAALLVSSFHAFLAAYLEAAVPLQELAGRLNHMIRRAATDDKFITAFFGILDPGTGAFHALNAGHNPIYILRAGTSVQEVVAGGLPLGMLDLPVTYPTEELILERGDRLLLYTDGIPEAANEHNEFFETRLPLKEWMGSRRPEKAETFIQELIQELKHFTGTAPQNDDITALYLMRQ